MPTTNNQATAAGISAAGNIGASLIQNEGNKRSQKRAERANLKFWNLQNEYNDPSAQMARLRKAGLNPHLIYGSNASGASGNAEAIAPAKAADYEMRNPLGDVSTFADFRQKEAVTDNLKEQNTVLQQEALLKAASTANTTLRTAQGQFDLDLAKELRTNSLQAAQANVRRMEAQALGEEIETYFKHSSVGNRIKDIALRVQMAKSELHGQNLKNQLLQWEKELSDLGITKNDPWYRRIFGTAKEWLKEQYQKEKDSWKKFEPIKKK